MILENGMKVYNALIERCVNYVNKGWCMSYKPTDLVGLEIDNTFIFAHFNKEDYTKDAYPIGEKEALFIPYFVTG